MNYADVIEAIASRKWITVLPPVVSGWVSFTGIPVSIRPDGVGYVVTIKNGDAAYCVFPS